MSVTITETAMTSDVLDVRAEWSQHRAADGHGGWVVSWLPLRLFDRNAAISAMLLAEEVAARDGYTTATRWHFIEALAEHLCLSGDQAVRELRRHATGSLLAGPADGVSP